jgi:DNA-binding transcriptional ArsR family regulator
VNASIHADAAASRVAAAIGEPARATMLYSLMDGHARTSTELAIAAAVSPSTASVHLSRLKTARLVTALVQGKHRYYSLAGKEVAYLLETLNVLAGGNRAEFVSSTPCCLCAARTCYDHVAGKLGVRLHDRFLANRWLSAGPTNTDAYQLTAAGTKALNNLGFDINALEKVRRRFAYPCLDWSERRPHVAGSLGSAILTFALKRKWLTQHLDSRALDVTRLGRREMLAHFGLNLEDVSSVS